MTLLQTIARFVAKRPFLANPKRPEIVEHDKTLAQANAALEKANRRLFDCEERERRHLTGC